MKAGPRRREENTGGGAVTACTPAFVVHRFCQIQTFSPVGSSQQWLSVETERVMNEERLEDRNDVFIVSMWVGF